MSAANLVLQGAKQSYVFRHDELQHYAESLLASLVKDCAGDDPTTAAAAGTGPAFATCKANAAEKTVLMNMNELPSGPLTTWPAAVAVAHSIYRCQYIKPDLLNSVLQGIADKTAKPFTGHFQQLSGLLAYLNLPGDIRDYLPPLATLSIKHSTVLTFCHNCDDLLYQYRMKHAAEEAVDKMLSFKPFGKVSMTSGDAARILRDNGSRFAVFAIALSKRHGLGVPLKVYLVHGIHDYVTRQQETPADLYKQYLDSLKAGVSSGWRQPVTMTLRQRHDKVAPSCAEVLHSGGLGPCNDLNAVLADMKLVGPKKQHGFWESFPPSYDELIGHTKRAFIMHTAGTTLSAFELLLQLYKGGVVEWEYPLWLLGW